MLALATTANVYASGHRGDSPGDSTPEGARCWVDGYDPEFSGKYDKEPINVLRKMMNITDLGAMLDSGLTKIDCDEIKQNPVNLEHKSLKEENTSGCFNDGLEDGKAHRPFNKDRSSACSEYGSQTGCESDSTEESCELAIQGIESYCPNNPDNIACVGIPTTA